MSYCECDETKYRMGDDCSIVQCLNMCTGNGNCTDTGQCECEENYYGVDCSIRIQSLI